MAANLMAIVGTMKLFEMQDEPDFEAGIRTTDPHAMLRAEGDSLRRGFVLVSVEHSPNLISGLVRIGGSLSRRLRESF